MDLSELFYCPIEINAGSPSGQHLKIIVHFDCDFHLIYLK